MTTVYVDAETIGTDDPAVIADIAASIKPPKNYSKEETILKWEAEEKPALLQEALLKTAFDGGCGRIVCIGWAVDDADPQLSCYSLEANILKEFFRYVSEAAELHYRGGTTKQPLTFVGHNIAAFDLRFLWQRAVINNIKPPSAIPFNVKPWDTSIADTQLMWNPSNQHKTSLDRLCRALGVPSPKSEMDGGQVWDYYKAGRIAEIAEYCRRDVVATRECYRRMKFMSGESLPPRPVAADLPLF